MRSRCGFTLVEMIAVTVIMTLLLTAVTTVLRSVLRESGIANDQSELPTVVFSAQLRRDLENARSFRIRRAGFELRGPIASDSATHQALLTSADVTYTVRSTTRGGLLVRTERPIGMSLLPNARQTRVEPMWLGADSITLTTSYLDFGRDELLDARADKMQVEQWRALPPSFKVALVGASGNILFSEVIFSGGGQ